MFDLIVTPDGGEPIELEAGMRDVRMWEKTHRGRALAAHLGDGMKAEYLFELAYAACRRQQLIPADLTEQDFTERYEIELEEPGTRARRKTAAAFKAELNAATAEAPPELPAVGEPEDESGLGVDPTPPGASPGQ